VSTEIQVVGDKVSLDVRIVPQLVKRLQRKELDAKNLARYSADVLWPDGPYAKKAFDLKSKELAKEKAKMKEEEYTGMFTCGRCKSKRTTFYLLQTRSADEPMVSSLLLFLVLFAPRTNAPALQTAFITCMSCGNRWKG
jgi:DNA-directed RNA polymerase subunit M/transcription elongation factor TFIIS